MTDRKLLQAKIEESGLPKTFIAKRLGLSRYGLAKKIDGQSDFKSEEILTLCEVLNIKTLTEREKIFFVKKVD